MSHWWDPRLWVRVKELEVLEKQAAAMQARGIPVPVSLQAKIADLTAKVSGA